MAWLAWLLFIIPAITGSLVWLRWGLAREKITILTGGTITGLAAFTLILFGAYIRFPLSPLLLVSLLSLCLCLSFVIILNASYKSLDLLHKWRHLSLDKFSLFVLLLSTLLFSVIAPKLLLVTDKGSLATGIINAYGDVAWHTSNVTYFVNNHSFPPENPIFSQHPLVYPFLTNFFSAALMVGGFSLPLSLTVPAVILIPLLLTSLNIFARGILKNSPLLALLVVIFFLFGGATLGFTRFGNDWQASGQSLGNFLWKLPQADYSGVGVDPNGFHFLNPTTSLLLPQRTFLFGLPLSLFILYLFSTAATRSSRTHYVFAGILSGILPLFHAHSIIALIPAILIIWLPRKEWRASLSGFGLFLVTALLVGLPSLLYYRSYLSESSSFFRWEPGWTASGNLVWFWLKNTGFLLPFTLLGLILPAPIVMKRLALAGLVLFTLANLFLFAPWAWDNFKLLIYFFIFSLPLFAWVLGYAWKKFPLALAGIIPVIIVLQIASATLDIWKLTLPTAAIWDVWDRDTIAAAAMITQATPPDSVIATYPNTNSPVVLTGRPRYLGYAAHVWSHGGDPWQREQALKSFYQGQRSVLPEAPVNYVLVGPAEKANYPGLVIQKNWNLVAQTSTHQLYQIQP